jgi:hypothetical protein
MKENEQIRKSDYVLVPINVQENDGKKFVGYVKSEVIGSFCALRYCLYKSYYTTKCPTRKCMMFARKIT